MTQGDLFQAPDAPRCGNCVMWNRSADAQHGHCTPVGDRSSAQTPCAGYFGLEQLRAALYDRKLG